MPVGQEDGRALGSGLPGRPGPCTMLFSINEIGGAFLQQGAMFKLWCR
jgi:hypothetical protein